MFLTRKYAIILSGILTGTASTMFAFIGDSVPVLSSVFLRVFLATLLFFVVMSFVDKRFYAVSRSDLKSYALVGLTLASTLSLYFLAISFYTISSVTLILSSYVVFVAIFASIFLKERLKKAHKVSIALAIIGLAIVSPFSGKFNMIGALLALCSAIVYAIFLVYSRYTEKKNSIGSIFWIFLFATLYLSPFVFKFGFGELKSVIPYVLIMGLVSTGLAYLLLLYGLKKVKAETAAVLTIVSHTLSALLFAVFLIGEVLTIRLIIGGIILISSGVYLLYSKKIKHFLHHH
jgi:drug/metabolite transporter (DMT)-like permease